MTTLTDHSARWLPAFSFNHYLGFLQSCPIEVRVMFVAVMVSICLSLGTLIEHQNSKLDDRVMMSALLAAGGMPLIYTPPALCNLPNPHARFDHSDIRALLRD